MAVGGCRLSQQKSEKNRDRDENKVRLCKKKNVGERPSVQERSKGNAKDQRSACNISKG